MYKRILVPVDGSPTSMAGLREAVRLAKAQRAKLRLVHVVDELAVMLNFDGYYESGDLVGVLRDAGKKLIAEAAAFARKHGVKAETSMIDSVGVRVADAIVKDAGKWRADLLVIGTHGRRGVTRMVLGSDAEAVLRETRVPVLLVRSRARRK